MNQLEWLQTALEPTAPMELGRFVIALAGSIVASAFVAGLHRRFYQDSATDSGMQRSFLLVGPAIATLFLAIQFSVPLSLGLFGVFSIVRFRNPVRDPEEIGYLMLLLSSAVLCAVSQYLPLAIFLGLATAALTVRSAYSGRLRPRRKSGIVMITAAVDRQGLESRFRGILESHLPGATVQSFSYTEGLLTASCHFSGPEAPSLIGLEESLGAIGEVQQVDVFFSQSGPIGLRR